MKKLILLVSILLISINSYATDFPYSFTTATQRMDGTALGLSEIKGHNLYCGIAVSDYPDKTFYLGAQLPKTSIIISNLPAGTSYCVVTTVDKSDRESLYSTYITLENDAKALPKSPTIPPGTIIRGVSTLP